eukprot:scaffold62695_cov70-Phaeocystis_antarctica.AAC.1
MPRPAQPTNMRNRELREICTMRVTSAERGDTGDLGCGAGCRGRDEHGMCVASAPTRRGLSADHLVRQHPHSPTPRFWNCPCAALSVCFAQFVFDFDAVKALLGDDRSFALEILDAVRARARAPLRAVGLAPAPAPASTKSATGPKATLCVPVAGASVGTP